MTYSNPFWPRAFPDPFILKVRGRYYAYATEPAAHPSAGSQVFPILTSSDLVHWEEAGKALAAFGTPYFYYWAPEVTAYNGRFFLYYAVHTEEFKGGIRVAVADSPTGPFVDSGHDLTTAYLPWAIDPHVFRDEAGQWYLYMTIEYWNDPVTGFTGSGNAVARLLDPFTLQGNITRVTPPGQRWQLYEAQRPEKGGIDWYTVEGPTVMRHRGRYYEMFSGGCYYRDNYAVSFATSDMPMGPGGMHDTSWHDWEGAREGGRGEPFLMRGDGEHFISPGHNSLVLGPDNVEQYLVYHALQKDMQERRPCLDRLFWHGAIPWTPAPTHTLRPAPAMPRLRELFANSMLASSWQAVSGHWRVSDSAVIQEDVSLTQTLLRQQARLGANWLLEINLRALTENGSYGALLHSDTQDALQISLTHDAGLLVKPAAAQPEAITLPQGTILQAWHQLLIARSGSVLSIQLDGLTLLKMLLEATFSTFSLMTASCQAAFSAISLTDHYRDEFLNNNYSPATLGWTHGEAERERQAQAPIKDALADWRIHDGALEQTSPDQGTHILLKGSPGAHYEFGATLRLQNAPERAEVGLGCVIQHSKTERTFIWLSQHATRWRLVIETPNNTPGATLDLPDTFNPLDWHALRLERLDDQLHIYLDGPHIFTVSIQTHQETVGLATRHASAAFTGVWQTLR